MNNPLLKSFIVYNIDEHKIIRSFKDIFSDIYSTALNGYSSLLKLLLTSQTDLCTALHNMIVFSEQELVWKYIRTNDKLILKAIEYDVEIIKELSIINASDIKKYLSEKFKTDLSEMPEYEKGEFPYDASYFIKYCDENGSGIFAEYKAFIYDGKNISPVLHRDPVKLSDLKLYEIQRNQIIENTVCFINNKPAVNTLLYGDRGTGKSSTIKALLNEYSSLRMIQIDKSQISRLFDLYDVLREIPLHFIIFIDDLSFSEDDDGFFALKQALDGSLSIKPDNVLIYATTNRRHIIKETALNRSENYVHKSDAVDDNMSLSERFGLFVTFSSPNKDQFTEIALKIAESRGLNIDKDTFTAGVERFALKRGGRSPRIAKQYVDMIEARLALGLEIK